MSESLYRYYEHELVFFRQLAPEFAKQYPGAASRLLLEPSGRSVDPHVERLIESFALIAGRIRHKIDDEFPELTESLLGVLYPHYLAPIPSMAIIQFEVDPLRAEQPDGFRIERHSPLHTQPVGDLPCRFRTGYPVTLWPLEVTEAWLQPPPFPQGFRPPAKTQAALRLELTCPTPLPFAAMGLDRLRFYLNGENAVMASLYELIFNNTTQVMFRPLERDSKAEPVVLKPEECLFQVGFDREDGLLPYPSHSFVGYRLLTEFFTFPSKFLFLDLGGFRRVCPAGFGRKLEVVLFLNRSLPAVEQAVNAQTFRLGCTPIINLFEQTAEPIALNQARYEYPIIPDRPHPLGMEVYSVDDVFSVDPTTNTTTDYQPFYSFRHGTSARTQKAFWYTSRVLSMREADRGTDVYLNLVDLDFNPRLPAESTVIVRTTCTNRNLPAKLAVSGEELELELEAAAPIHRVRCVRSPTAPLRPPLRRGGHWRLISHLTLNHLSLTDPVEGKQALQEILKLYDFSDPEAGQQLAAVTQQVIEGITSVTSRRVVGRVPARPDDATGGQIAGGFCRGVEVSVELDEQKFIGSGAFLFACVLERFLGLYASINSFSQLVARTVQGEGSLKKWPPRAGELQLL
jgi:type VI secretion system protein ImpG